MNTRDEATELGSLLRSRFPIILIESHEEPRILELLKKACNLENQALMTWSITSGIRRHGRDEAVHQTNDLLDALKHIDRTPQNGVYVLCDAHPGFKDPVSMRLIREIALSHYRNARTLVFLSPRLDELPSEILRLSAHFRPTLPDREAIRAIVMEEAKRHESQTGEKPRGDRGAARHADHAPARDGAGRRAPAGAAGAARRRRDRHRRRAAGRWRSSTRRSAAAARWATSRARCASTTSAGWRG